MMEAMLQHLKMKRTLAAASMEAAAKKAAADAALAAKTAAQDPAQKAARDGAVWKQVQEPAAHITPAAWCAPEMVGCSDAEINRRSLEGYMVRSKWKTGCLQLSYEEGDKNKGHAGAEKVKPGQNKTKTTSSLETTKRPQEGDRRVRRHHALGKEGCRRSCCGKGYKGSRRSGCTEF